MAVKATKHVRLARRYVKAVFAPDGFEKWMSPFAGCVLPPVYNAARFYKAGAKIDAPSLKLLNAL